VSDEDLPEIIIPDDGLATRNLPVPAPSPWAGFPERPDKVWVVATHPDGSLYAIEIPKPEQITLESERKAYEEEDGAPYWLRDFYILPTLGPLKLRVMIDGFDADKHPGEPRPDPFFSIRIYPPGTLNL
jgi:hypothetical protein